MFRDASAFSNRITKGGPVIEMADNTTVPSAGSGTVEFSLRGNHVSISNALYVPQLGKNLFSIGQAAAKFLVDNDDLIIYKEDGFVRPKGKILAVIPKGNDNVWRLKEPATPTNTPLHHSKHASSASAACVEDNETTTVMPGADDANDEGISFDIAPASFANACGSVSQQLLHERLGHLNSRDMQTLVSKAATGIQLKRGTVLDEPCEPCIMAKMHRSPFAASKTVTSRPGEIVFSDTKRLIPDGRYLQTRTVLHNVHRPPYATLHSVSY